MKGIAILLAALFSSSVLAKAKPGDYLVKFSKEIKSTKISRLSSRLPAGTKIEDMNFEGWVHIQLPKNTADKQLMAAIAGQPGVLHVQPNYILKPFENYSAQLAKLRPAALRLAADETYTDNPDIPTTTVGGTGADPLFSSQWGMNQIGVMDAWKVSKGANDMVVAVIDTGVDYTHEDLQDTIWRNPGEVAGNGIDDDNNGYIDDIIGWDFASQDNKPYDLRVSDTELFSGGNPGHGTHCAGNVGARGDNGMGIAGVAPNIKIMPLRFITEKGQGTTKDAADAINYAVKMGAKITSNSWGSEGEDANDPDNKLLRDAIKYSEAQGVIFVAAAGNGHNGVGYNNDTDSAPAYPASYDDAIIISVAAIDKNGALGSFSNWGAKSVDIGAPGVNVFSTMVGDKYSNVVLDYFGYEITWDGTSMATPHVAGAAALYWSAHPEKTWQEVKAAILKSAKSNGALNGKSVSNGILDVGNLMKM